MIMQGCVKGTVYPVVQQAFGEPIDGTKRCKRCGRKFEARGNRRYCSEECRIASNADKHKESSRRYAEKMRRARMAVAS